MSASWCACRPWATRRLYDTAAAEARIRWPTIHRLADTPPAQGSPAAQSWHRLEAWGWAREWTGSDPYDGLNARRVVGPLRRSAFGRRVITQCVKRSPIDLRPLLGVPPGRSAAALAHVVSAYAVFPELAPDVRQRKLAWAVAALRALRLDGPDEACWGYHFDVQTRVFFYPEGLPNTIATAFAGMALLDAYEATGQTDLRDEAESAGDFFLRHVPQTAADGGAFFGYLVGDRTPIHNANMLVCGLLARLGAACGRRTWPTPRPQASPTRSPTSAPTGHGPTGRFPGSSGSTTSTPATCSTA